jgi:hypothetical protein
MTTERHPYSPLGYPLTNLPRPGKPVSSLTVYDTVYPLLHGARALLTAVSVSLRTEDLNPERASWALALIEGQLECALHILQRWEETQHRAPGAAGDEDEE